jgi:hypothetical protein
MYQALVVDCDIFEKLIAGLRELQISQVSSGDSGSCQWSDYAFDVDKQRLRASRELKNVVETQFKELLPKNTSLSSISLLH